MKLPNVRGTYKLNYKLAHLTWFKVGGPAKVLFKPEDIRDLISFLKQNNGKLPIVILGTGSNIIIRDQGIEGVVIKLGRNFTEIKKTVDGNLSVGAGCLNYNLAKFCQTNSIQGLEFLIGIPGTIGGGIAMNAGAYGSEFKDIVIAVEAVDINGKLKVIPMEKFGFSYRKNNLSPNLIFTKAILKSQIGDIVSITNRVNKIIAMRISTQPVNEKTSGSTFVNPKGLKAWELIDKVGLRGFKIGGAGVSPMHCNFMINYGNATAEDIEKLGEYIREKVKENSGVQLEWEIRRIGKNA